MAAYFGVPSAGKERFAIGEPRPANRLWQTGGRAYQLPVMLFNRLVALASAVL
jgi:hypothetical protein